MKNKHIPGGWLIGLTIGICFGGAIAGPIGIITFGILGAILGHTSTFPGTNT
jgi:hypothetical protein